MFRYSTKFEFNETLLKKKLYIFLLLELIIDTYNIQNKKRKHICTDHIDPVYIFTSNISWHINDIVSWINCIFDLEDHMELTQKFDPRHQCH